MRLRLILLCTLFMLSGCVAVHTPTLDAVVVGQPVLTVEPGKVEVRGAAISEFFGKFLDGLLNAVPFGRGTQPDIHIYPNRLPPDPVPDAQPILLLVV